MQNDKLSQINSIFVNLKDEKLEKEKSCWKFFHLDSRTNVSKDFIEVDNHIEGFAAILKTHIVERSIDDESLKENCVSLGLN